MKYFFSCRVPFSVPQRVLIAAVAAVLLFPASSFPAPTAKDSPATADEAISRGDESFRRNRWTEAEGLYLDAAARVPRSIRYVEAMRKAGQCRVKLKDYRKARKHFEAATGDARSRKDSPDEAARAFSALHALLLEHGDAAARERLLADFRRALPDSPRLPRAFEREGDACLSAGSHGKAAAFYRAAGSGLSPCGTNILAIAEASRPGASAAVSDDDLRRYAAVIADRPELAKPLCDLLAARRDGWRAEDAYASFLLDSKKPAEAAAVWESMLKGRRGPADRIAFRRAEAVASQDSTKGMDALREWLSRHGGSPLRERAEFALAMLVARTAPPTEASAAIEGFLAAYPDSPLAGEAKAALAKAKRAGKEMAKAETDAAARKDAAAKDPFGASLRKAEGLLAANRPQEALPIFRKLAENRREPRWGRAVLGLGRALRDSGDTDAALEAWDGLWRRARAEAGIACAAEARRAMGDALLEDRGDPAKALAAYDEAAACDPAKCGDPAFDRGRAVALLALGRGGEALPQIAARRGEAAKGDPADALRWRRLEALCAAGRAVPPSPSDRPARVSLALADGFFASGDYRAARKRYRAASRLFGDRAGADEADLGEALSLAAAGKAKEALAAYLAFGKNHRGSPLAPLALLRAGTLQASPALGDAKKARKIFERLMEDHPRSKEAVAAEFYVATLAWREGRWAETRALHEAFVANHPDSPLVPAIVNGRLPAIGRKSQDAKIDLGTYRVYVGPKDRKRRAIPISSESAVHATLEIRPKDAYDLLSSVIVDQDSRGAGALWAPGPKGPKCHTYYLSDAFAPDNAFSSQEYVLVEGALVPPSRPGTAKGRGGLPGFSVTVPSVDIDWEEYQDWDDEDSEETRKVAAGVTDDAAKWKRITIHKPRDNELLVHPVLRLSWEPGDAASIIGANHAEFPNGARIDARRHEKNGGVWPISFDVHPRAACGDLVFTLVGQNDDTGDEGSRAIDRVHGILVDADIVGYAAWRGTYDKAVPDEEEADPGFLVTMPADVHPVTMPEYDPLPARLKFKGVPANVGLQRSYRFSRGGLVLIRQGAIDLETTSQETPIPCNATEDYDINVVMKDPGTYWGETSYVDVEYIVRDANGAILDTDTCRLLRPYVVAIGDSLTYGVWQYVENGEKGTRLPIWKCMGPDTEPYPSESVWNNAARVTPPWNIYSNRLQNTYQGYRGYLAEALPGFTWLGMETNGHGPRHNGFPGAKTIDISRLLDWSHLDKSPSYTVVIFFSGMNDCNRVRTDQNAAIFDVWMDFVENIKAVRVGKGRTLLLALKLPPTRSNEFFGFNFPSLAVNIRDINGLIGEYVNSQDPTNFIQVLTVPTDIIIHPDAQDGILPDDGMHFDDAGYQSIARTIKTVIVGGLK